MTNILWERVLFNYTIPLFSTFSDSVLIVYNSNIPWEAVLVKK